MKKLALVFVVPALAGCLTSTVPDVAHWPLVYCGEAKPPSSAEGICRVAQVVVRQPYESACLSVLRADGTLERDPYNEFAAQPGALLKGVVFDALEASGRFKTVVNASSSVQATLSVEVLVTRLALDCRREGERQAIAELQLRVLRGGDLQSLEKGTGASDAGDGNYGAAFSRAVSAALSSVCGSIR